MKGLNSMSQSPRSCYDSKVARALNTSFNHFSSAQLDDKAVPNIHCHRRYEKCTAAGIASSSSQEIIKPGSQKAGCFVLVEYQH